MKKTGRMGREGERMEGGWGGRERGWRRDENTCLVYKLWSNNAVALFVLIDASVV